MYEIYNWILIKNVWYVMELEPSSVVQYVQLSRYLNKHFLPLPLLDLDLKPSILSRTILSPKRFELHCGFDQQNNSIPWSKINEWDGWASNKSTKNVNLNPQTCGLALEDFNSRKISHVYSPYNPQIVICSY